MSQNNRIARDWNAKDGAVGYVTRFQVRARFLERYPMQVAGARQHQEYWIPAKDLETLNANIVGRIEVIASFGEPPAHENQGNPRT
jgi:hypothetical protein